MQWESTVYAKLSYTQTTMLKTITQLHLKFLGAFDLYISNMLSHTQCTHTCLPSLKFKCSQVPEVLFRRLFTTACMYVCT